MTLAVAAALPTGFVVIQRRSPAPLVDLNVFRRRSLTGGNVVATLASATFAPMFFLVSVYLQEAEGWSALRTGVAFLPMAAVLILTSGVLGPRLLPHVGVTPMAVGSLLMIAAGSTLFAITLDPDRSYLLAVLPAMLMVATGMGLVFPAFMSAAVAGVPDRQQGLASGLVNTASRLGLRWGWRSWSLSLPPWPPPRPMTAVRRWPPVSAPRSPPPPSWPCSPPARPQRSCGSASGHPPTPGHARLRPPRPHRPARPSTASGR